MYLFICKNFTKILHELGCELMRICVIYRISKKIKKYQICQITKAGENIVSS